ncbi:MAG: low molecular weight phosphatase family protein [Candidatus Nanohaloarchaea archaeon]|nr:low molecular weight phosphatase family protein [Candidatus Nanohaloarchaea archaeon]
MLYICRGNSFRSPVAEALTRRFHTGTEVESAGTRPANRISEEARRLLEEDGAEQYLKPEPERISQRAVKEADRIIAMTSYQRKYVEERFPEQRSKIRVWKVPDPLTPEITPEESYHRIRNRVRNLNLQPSS